MSDTYRFKMPLLDAAQAQKHVTINESLVRADVLAAATVLSRSAPTPPPSPTDGDAFIVEPGSTGAWAGKDGEIAMFLNGGWEFVAPWPGATFWVQDESARVVFDGVWIADDTTNSPNGAASLTRVLELDHTLSLDASSTTTAIIPDKAVVLGVTGRVITEITGATGWSIGVPGSIDRYGTGYGTGLNSFAHGVSGQPLAYYGGTSLVITAEGSDFTAGTLRLAVHCLEIQPPAAV
ncbi:MAG: DUF2793 domain-containing protein [Pseudomonadota bacterium]